MGTLALSNTLNPTLSEVAVAAGTTRDRVLAAVRTRRSITVKEGRVVYSWPLSGLPASLAAEVYFGLNAIPAGHHNTGGLSNSERMNARIS